VLGSRTTVDVHLRTAWQPAVTTALTCRAGCKEGEVSKNRNAGPVKCYPWLAAAYCGTSMTALRLLTKFSG
jgi:hypothetical protein